MTSAETEKPLLTLQGILLYCTIFFYESDLWWTILLFSAFVILVEFMESRHFNVWFKRWQLHPIHIIALIEFNQTILLRQRDSTVLPYVYVLLLIVSLASTILVPVNQIPSPTGPYLVGTTLERFEVEDEKKQNMFDKSSHYIKRMVTIKIWYPAESPTQLTSVNVNNAHIYSDDIRNHWGYGKLDEKIPFLTSPSFHLTRSNANYGAPIKENSKKFRVILYEHGQGSIPEKNSSLIEDLVSHGYVVVAFYHDDWDKSWPGPAQRRIVEIRHMLKHIRGCFGGKLDIESGVVVMGHSFGGSTVVSICTNGKVLQEVNILGGIAMDPWIDIFSLESMSQVERNMLMLNSDLWLSKKSDLEKIDRLKGGSLVKDLFVCVLKGTSHYNFGDTFYTIETMFGKTLLPFLEEENSTMCLFGPAKQREMHKEMKSLVRSFVDSLMSNGEVVFADKWQENQVENKCFKMNICRKNM